LALDVVADGAMLYGFVQVFSASPTKLFRFAVHKPERVSAGTVFHLGVEAFKVTAHAFLAFFFLRGRYLGHWQS
jgi:hypothetical protein